MLSDGSILRQSKRNRNSISESPQVVDASLLIIFLTESLAREANSMLPWPKQQALDICLQAVDLLKSQMKEEAHLNFIPSWIKESEFVRQYEEDFPEEEVLKLDNNERLFEFPDKLCEDSVLKVMDNVRYFGITDNSLVVKQLFKFYISCSNQHLIESQKESFPELRVLWDSVEFTLLEANRYAFTMNAASKNLAIALWHAHENGYPWNESTCSKAAEGGHLDCLKYAHENGCPWNESTCSGAASQGHFDCLKYAHENGCPWNESACSKAASQSHFDCLKYAHEKGCPWNESTCSKAAEGGRLDCLKYAHENGCPWDKETCSGATIGGHFDCLKYAHENGCPWDKETCSNAADAGDLDCLKYAHENGCPWDKDTCSNAGGKSHANCFEYATIKRLPAHALHEIINSLCSCLRGGNDLFQCLKYAHENGCAWDETTCSNAAAGGHLDCLKYAHENGCPWDNNTTSNAAHRGHLDCLKYAHENGCPWNKSLFSKAAEGGHLDCLKYAHENSCPWDENTCFSADAECLQYAQLFGSPSVSDSAYYNESDESTTFDFDCH